MTSNECNYDFLSQSEDSSNEDKIILVQASQGLIDSGANLRVTPPVIAVWYNTNWKNLLK